MKLCYAGGFGYHAYGLAGWDRRTRVVVASLQKNKKGAFEDVSRIVTWKRLDNKHFTKIDTERFGVRRPPVCEDRNSFP